jgi:hypothetical protein
MKIFFLPSVCVLKETLLAATLVFDLSSDRPVQEKTYLTIQGIPIRVHRRNQNAEEELWLMSSWSGQLGERQALLLRAHLLDTHRPGFLAFSGENRISFRDKSAIVLDRDGFGLQILWKGQWTRGRENVIPISDPQTGSLDGVIAIEGKDGLQAVLAVRVWGEERHIVLYKPDGMLMPRPFLGSRMNGIEIAHSGGKILMSIVGNIGDKDKATLFLLPERRVLWEMETKRPDHICAAFPIPAGTWGGLQRDGIGVILARSAEDKSVSFLLQAFEADAKADKRPALEIPISDLVFGSAHGPLHPWPEARVSPDRRFLVVETASFRCILRIPAQGTKGGVPC